MDAAGPLDVLVNTFGVIRVAAAGGATYSASKHAVVGFAEATRHELAGSGIDVSMVLALTRRVQEGMARAVGADRVLAEVDDAARSAYEARLRPPASKQPRHP